MDRMRREKEEINARVRVRENGRGRMGEKNGRESREQLAMTDQ